MLKNILKEPFKYYMVINVILIVLMFLANILSFSFGTHLTILATYFVAAFVYIPYHRYKGYSSL